MYDEAIGDWNDAPELTREMLLLTNRGIARASKGLFNEAL